LDAYWTTSVKAWDAAAGILLVEEAGGIVSNLQGGPFDLDNPEFIAAATPELHAELLETLRRAEGAA
jgi:myo-inositol-1(or 4)-monophosphatase